jgi:predicted transcriptional regulator
MARKHSSVRLDPKDLKELEKIAKAEDRNVAWLIRKAVSEFVERATKGGK